MNIFLKAVNWDMSSRNWKVLQFLHRNVKEHNVYGKLRHAEGMESGVLGLRCRMMSKDEPET